MNPIARLRDAVAAASLMPEAPAGGIAPDRITGSKSASKAPPGAFTGQRPHMDELLGFIERCAMWCERANELVASGAPAKGWTEDRKLRIIGAYEGLESYDVSFLERIATETVRKIRSSDGRDPDTGRKF